MKPCSFGRSCRWPRDPPTARRLLFAQCQTELVSSSPLRLGCRLHHSSPLRSQLAWPFSLSAQIIKCNITVQVSRSGRLRRDVAEAAGAALAADKKNDQNQGNVCTHLQAVLLVALACRVGLHHLRHHHLLSSRISPHENASF